MQPFVSVVMANYNGGKYLRRTISSVLDQSYTNFEFIMVDDCSTDNSREIMEEFAKKDERVRTLFLEENSQVCVATNCGLELAEGAYIARIDSDDVWRPGKLDKQIDYLLAHPECGCCFTLVDIIDENDDIVNEKQPELYRLFDEKNKSQEEWIRDLFFKGNSLCHASAVMPADVLQTVGDYHPAYLQLQDYHMWTKIAARYPIHILEERLVEYRRETEKSGSLSTMGNIKEIRRCNENILIQSHYFEQMDAETFARAFRPCFKNPDAETRAELLCEQAFLLGTPVFGSTKTAWPGIAAMEKLLSDHETESVLKEKYGISAKAFYDISRQYTMENALIAQFIPKEYRNEITLFFDRGEGFSTADMKQQRYVAEDGRLDVTMQFDASDLRQLRVDLLDGDSSVMKNIIIMMNGHEIDPGIINGYEKDGKICFETKDPEIIFDYKEEYGNEIRMQAEILAAGSMNFADSLQKHMAGIREKEALENQEKEMLQRKLLDVQTKYRTAGEELDALKKELQEKKEEISRTEETLISIAEECAVVKESLKARG